MLKTCGGNKQQTLLAAGAGIAFFAVSRMIGVKTLRQ